MKKFWQDTKASLTKLADWCKPYLQKTQEAYFKFCKYIQESKYFNLILTILLVVCIYFVIAYINNYEDAHLCNKVRSALGY